MKNNVRKMVITAMFAALAYVVMFFIRIPIMPAAPYLEYDPKDVLFVITGFLIGPVQGTVSVILVCLLEMVTVSKSGPIGLLMNVIASLFFVLPASLIYYRKKTLISAIIGLIAGMLSMSGAMILWNYLITPLYAGMPREAIVPMLPTVFLPFNMIKAGINMAITLLIYKPISIVLHRSGLLPKEEKETKKEGDSGKFSPLAIILGILMLGGCICAIFLIKNR